MFIGRGGSGSGSGGGIDVVGARGWNETQYVFLNVFGPSTTNQRSKKKQIQQGTGGGPS